jgi:hypothetical protein
MEKCIFAPHDRKTVCCCPHEKTHILTEEGSEKKITSTMKIHYLDRNISTLFIDLKTHFLCKNIFGFASNL